MQMKFTMTRMNSYLLLLAMHMNGMLSRLTLHFNSTTVNSSGASIFNHLVLFIEFAKYSKVWFTLQGSCKAGTLMSRFQTSCHLIQPCANVPTL